ncbi:MAG: ABC transporter ATP-binding protein [Chloroflexota bacterium]
MTALQNVMFGMEMRGVKKNAAKEKAQRALDMVQLPQVAARKPKQMSGGQQQRVALARALVNEPAVLLLDEPLGALDLKLRKQMQFELKDMQTRLGITFVFVTHDQEEALTMADRIAVLSDGKVLQVGTPSDIYENPVNRFVADFIGETNFLDGTLVEKTHESVEEFTVNDEVITGTLSRVKLRDGTVVEASLNDDTLAVDSPVAIALRPERIDVLPESGTVRGAGRAEVTVENALASIRAERNMNVVNGEIVQTVYIGTDTRYIIRLTDNTEVVVRQQNHGAGYDRTMESGESCYVVWDAENARVLAS